MRSSLERLLKNRVLLVDADPGVWRAVSEALDDGGAELVRAENSEQAVRRFLETTPDLLLIDVMAPPSGGLSLLRRIRGLPRGSDVPVFLLSGLKREADVRREGIGELLAIGLIKKPLRPEPIREALAAVRSGPAEKVAPAPPFGSPQPIGQGQLDRLPLPLILQSLAWKRATGCLFLKSFAKRKILFLREGAITFALSNEVQETLGEYLLGHGKIGKDTLRAGLEAMKNSGKKFGEFLVESRALGLEEVLESVRRNILEKVLGMFRWDSGEFRLSPFKEPPAPLPGRTLDVPQVLWEGLGGSFPLETMLASLKPYSRHVVSPFRNVGDLEKERTYGREDLATLASCAALSGRRVADALSDLKGGRQLRLFYYLLVRGYLVLEEGDGAPGADRSLQPAGGRAVAEARLRLKSVRDENPFQVLRVPLDATDDRVHQAYLRLAHEVHPDALGPEAGEELRRIHEELFRVTSAAFRAIETEALRRDRVRSLLNDGRPEEQQDISSIVEAEELFHKGQAFARKRNWRGAADAFREALRLHPEEGEYALQLGVAVLGLGGNGAANSTREAEELFEKALRLMPSSAEPHYRLGRLALARGDREGAAEHFRKSLKKNQDHVGAARELRILKMRAGGGERGLVAGLFGRSPIG